MTTESKLTKQIIQHLERLRRSGRNVWSLKIHGHAMQRAGVPDLLILLDGQYLWIEIKKPGGVPTKLQSHEMQRIEAAGGRTCVVTSLAEFLEAALRHVRLMDLH